MATLFNAMLLNAVAATGLALLVWGAGWIPAVRRRPGLRHCLWGVVLAKLVTPPLFQWPVLPAWQSRGTASPVHSAAAPLPPATPKQLDSVAGRAADPQRRPSLRETTPTREAKGDLPAVDEAAVVPPQPFPWKTTLIAISLAGTIAVVVVSVRQSRELRRALRQSRCCDARLRRIAGASAKSMGLPAAPEVSVASANIPPLLWLQRSGPLVVLPRRLVDELSDEQLRCIVSHEIGHYLRRDHWTNLLSLLIAAVFWWHPLVWWVRRELRTAQEACCDAMVISRPAASRQIYATTLLHALEFLQVERSPLPSLASGFGGRSSTQRRFEMIANLHVNHRLSWWSYPLLLAALAALPCLPTVGSADKGERKDKGEVRGVVKSVDPAQRTVTVWTKKQGASTFELAKDAKVLLDNGAGKPNGLTEGKLADLAEGLAVTLGLSADKKVTKLKAEGPTVKGILKAADVVNRTITVAVALKKGMPAADQTFSVAKSAGVFIDDGGPKDKSRPAKPATLAELPLNSIVIVRLSVDRKVAGNIRAEGPRVAGRVKAVDAARNSITITIANKGEPAVDRTYTVAKTASVFIADGKPKDKTKPVQARGLADVPVGARVTLRLTVDGKSVVAVQAEGSNIHGSVKAVDAARNTLTLHHKIEGDKTYAVRPDAAVFLDGKNAARKLADVPVGAAADLKLQADQKLVLEIHISGPTVMGQVAGNAGNGVVTLRGKQGDNTYTVAAKSRIVLDGKKSGKLEDVIDGTFARLRLSADKTTVLEIHAEGPTYKGQVKAVDPGKSITLTIGGKGGVGGEDKDFTLTKSTVVVMEDSKTRLKLTDLQAGKHAVLRLSLDQKGVARITVLGE